ncbi:shikimate kinase [Radiobacillus kanasensis]|uniref:shikimate kinase n=1 Tax=Radiobacillus kanasensis TaxID=2844358 RepID=UPI001E2B9ED3|nr:shikimate kinase [Radiobacillus kanasensis]UFT97758.1 shikimate kinase [Radiobacillus kanasensis]
MKSIYLIGFMGSGKSSVSSCLAEHLKWDAKDTDRELEQYYNETIPDIFAKKGEETFRQYESHILQQMPETESVIATGGGIIGKQENREWMKSNGIVVFLQTSWDTIKDRLSEDTARPLWKDPDSTYLLYEHRLPLYEETAHLNIRTDQKSPDEIAEDIISLINPSRNG